MSKRKIWPIDRSRKRDLEKLCLSYDVLRKEGRDNLADTIKTAAHLADPTIESWLMAGLTEGMGYRTMEARGIPCGVDYYYDRRNKMLYHLDKLLVEKDL